MFVWYANVIIDIFVRKINYFWCHFQKEYKKLFNNKHKEQIHKTCHDFGNIFCNKHAYSRRVWLQ